MLIIREWFPTNVEPLPSYSRKKDIMTRVVNVVEKNIRPDPARVVLVPAITSTEVLPELGDTSHGVIEYSGRYIQNLTGGDIYYAFGQDCDDRSYHGLLQDKLQLDCSNHGASVCVWSAGGGNVSTTQLRRIDLADHQTMKPSYQLA